MTTSTTAETHSHTNTFPFGYALLLTCNYSLFLPPLFFTCSIRLLPLSPIAPEAMRFQTFYLTQSFFLFYLLKKRYFFVFLFFKNRKK
jgi:hypothetical protein